MTSRIIERISRQIGLEDPVGLLAEGLPGSDLQSLLLEVYRRRARRRSVGELLAEYGRNRFAQPGAVDPLVSTSFDLVAFGLLPAGFDRIALSPVAPLGTSSVVTNLDQNLAVATIRNTEVLSDSTNAMALECAVRRRVLLRARKSASERVRLASSHRLVRAQRFDGPLQFPHFHVFALATAGRDTGSKRFELENVAEHIGFYLRLIRDGLQVPVERIRVAVTPMTQASEGWVIEELIPALEQGASGEQIGIDRDRSGGRNYYQQACFKILAVDEAGDEVELADGGFVPWTQQLLSDRKERLMISGIGAERACQIFGQSLRDATPNA